MAELNKISKKGKKINMLSRSVLQGLIQTSTRPCVSVFMPTHRAGRETQQDPIRLKNLLDEAEERLTAGDLRAPEAREFLAPVRALLTDDWFWQHQGDGLAIFVAPKLVHSFRLPFNFDELLVVTNRFHLKPLLPFLSGDGRFYILALSQKEVRLLQGSRYSISEIDLKDVPQSLAEALRYDDPEKALQFHTGTPGGIGERAAIYHGHGAGVDEADENLRRYFRQVARGVELLLNEEGGPLILAGVDYLLPTYQEVNPYPHLLEQGVTGNPETLSADELHRQAWTIVQPHFLKARQEAVARYKQLVETKQGSRDLREILPAAYYGRIETLFVAIGLQQWGVFEPDTNTINLHQEANPENEDLLDTAAIQALLKGGVVYAVEPANMPDEAPLAAIFRY